MAHILHAEKDPLSPLARQSKSSLSSEVSSSKISFDKDGQHSAGIDGRNYSYSKEASIADSLGSQNPSLKSIENPFEFVANVLDSPSKAKEFQEFANQQFLEHYITFYENLSLIKALACTEMNILVHNLLKSKLKKLEDDFFVEKAPLKLSVPQELASSVCLKIAEFETTKATDAVNLSFLQPAIDSVMSALANSVLPKYRARYSSIPSVETPARISDVDTLKSIFNSKECDKFVIFLAKQNKLNLYFYHLRLEELREYSTTATSPIEKQTLNRMIKNMYRDFFTVAAPYQIFCTANARIEFEKFLKEISLNPTMLEPITKEVYNMLLQGSLQYYLNPTTENSISASQTVKDISGLQIISSIKLAHSNTHASKISNATVGSTTSQTSFGSSNLSSPPAAGGLLNRPHKLRPSDSPSEQMAKILDNPAKINILKELSDKFIMIHYIDFYERQNLVSDLAANDKNSMLIALMNLKLEEIQKDYLLENSPLKLMLFSEDVKQGLLAGIQKFKTVTINDTINVDFLVPAREEVTNILANALLSKFKQKKNKESSPVTSAARPEEGTIQLLVKVLDSEIECDKMIEILAKQHCMENLFYYQKQKEVYKYAASATSPIEKQTLKKMIKNVGKEFIVSNAPSELNIPSKLRSDFEEAVKDNNNIQPTILEPITKEVLNMLLRNSFPLYKK